MQHITSVLKAHKGAVVLAAITMLISILNVKPGTFLTGWDTLHPEFNFALNFERLLHGVWREEQGLGAVAGHSHMADLPRVFILWLLHFIAPLEALRYIYVFLCFIAGPLGMYYFFIQIFKRHQHAKSIAFLGALFYLFNLSTVQQFYVPFEMFPVQYAALPWLAATAYSYLESLRHGSQPSANRALFWYGLITLFATPQAYAAHLWYAFMSVFTLFLMLYVFMFKSKKTLKGAVVVFAVTLAINSFWLLPNLYFIATQSDVPKEAKQNRLFSQEYRLRNRENGTIQDAAIIRGFYFNWNIYNFKDQKIDELMKPWNNHLKNPLVASIGYLAFLGVCMGVYIAFTKKLKEVLVFTPFLAVPLILLLNSTPPFNYFFELITKIGIFEEAFRFLFTKISILLTFSYALFFAVFIWWVYEQHAKYRKLLLSIVPLLLILYCFPMFKGELISPAMKIAIPKDYFTLWDYMQHEPQGTIVPLPLHSFSGWQYYNWGYQGAGFIWFGLKQPILDRDFDRWEVANERAFREFQYGFYTTNPRLIMDLTEKYNVQYFLHDKSVTTVENKNVDQVLYKREIEKVLAELEQEGSIVKLRTFGNISVYKIQGTRSTTAQATIATNVLPRYQWITQDTAYQELGPYLSEEALLHNPRFHTRFYPMRGSTTFSDRTQSGKINANGVVATLLMDNPYPTKLLYKQEALPEDVSRAPSYALTATDIYNANINAPGILLKNDRLIFTSTKKQNGVYLDFSPASHEYGYILQATAKNDKGLPLRFCLRNLYTQTCSLYDQFSPGKTFTTDTFIIPPLGKGIGFGLSIDNLHFGPYTSQNELKEVKLLPISFESSIKSYFYNAPLTTKTTLEPAHYTRIFPYLYIAKTTSSHNYLIFQKPFNSHWKAYAIPDGSTGAILFPFIFGKELKNHVFISNWSNGWEYQSPSTVAIIFVPQYLEYAGGILTIATVLFLLIKCRVKEKQLRYTPYTSLTHTK